jgi:hypothetical protein
MSRPEEFVAAVFRVAGAVVETGVNVILRSLQEEIDKYDRDPRSFLYNDMVGGPAILLIAAVRMQGEDVLIDGLEWVWDEGDFGSRAAAALSNSPHLTAVQRTQFAAGFDYLDAKNWTLACTLLLAGVEGALWATAEALGSIDENRQLVSTSERSRILKGPNSVATEALSDLSPSFARFLDRQLFDYRGHDLRHGRGGRDERAHALFAALAILGLLDHYGETELMSEFGEFLSSYAAEQVGPDLPQATNHRQDAQ